jgi:site-specific recombinase XerD
LSAGLTLEEVGELLGHKSYQTTKVYAYLLPERSATQSKVAADAVQRFMLPPPLAAE